MPIENNHSCDDCGKKIDEGEECYCESCVIALRDELSAIEDKVEELEEGGGEKD